MEPPGNPARFTLLQVDQHLLPVGEDADDGQDGALTTLPPLRTRNARASR
jgi:hypothetical protein